jgi:hypothetical protein
VKIRGGTHRTLWSRSPIRWTLANGKTPPVLPPSENLSRYVEGLNDARMQRAGFLSFLRCQVGGAFSVSVMETQLRNHERIPLYAIDHSMLITYST